MRIRKTKTPLWLILLLVVPGLAYGALDFDYFCTWRPGGFGKADLYVSFVQGDTWTPLKNLGPRVNTPE
jgi:hypothetical protein